MPGPVWRSIVVRRLVARVWMLLLGQLWRLRKEAVWWKLCRVRREEVLRMPCCYGRQALLTEDCSRLHCSPTAKDMPLWSESHGLVWKVRSSRLCNRATQSDVCVCWTQYGGAESDRQERLEGYCVGYCHRRPIQTPESNIVMLF